jgi:hypothetical protein
VRKSAVSYRGLGANRLPINGRLLAVLTSLERDSRLNGARLGHVIFEWSEPRGDVRRNSSLGPFIGGISQPHFPPGVKAKYQPGGRILGLPPLPSEKYKKLSLRDEFHKGGWVFFLKSLKSRIERKF